MRIILFLSLILLSTNCFSQNLTSEDYFKSGLAKDKRKDFKGSIEEYTKAIEMNPLYAEAYYYRGLAKSDMSDFQGAVEDFSKAIEIKPDYSDAYTNRGAAKSELEDYNVSIPDYNKAIELNPKDNIVPARKHLFFQKFRKLCFNLTFDLLIFYLYVGFSLITG